MAPFFRYLLFPLALCVSRTGLGVFSFQPSMPSPSPTRRTWWRSGVRLAAQGSGSGDSFFNNAVLEKRLLEMRVHAIEEEIRLPPNPTLSAKEFVAEILEGLENNSEPFPDSGFRVLLRSSTRAWRSALFQAVGATPESVSDEQVASALGEVMAKRENQFGILVGEGQSFNSCFPTDLLDYSDGTCWVECQLRDYASDELLAITGWQLERRPQDGAWLVDRIDWQDFRDQFRPGIGREEWMRICG